MKQLPAPRLREPNRTNKLPRVTLDETLPDDHEARIVWKYVSALDMSPFLVDIRAVEGVPGRDATDPRLLLALWMFATVDGIGSARWLEELCVDHAAYRWLCGGVSVNYHMLSDFRRGYTEQLESTLKAHVSSLIHLGLITLNRVAQDGMRVRAHAGSGSFRRSQTIEECQKQVEEQLAQLKDQVDEPPGTAARRSRAAKKRHLEEKAARLVEAKKVALELEAKKAERRPAKPKGTSKEAGQEPEKVEGRGSMTDPEARRMKMPDGGYRPAYNMQAMTTTEEGVIVAVDVTNQGTDVGLMGPMIEKTKESYGEAPKQVINDGGFMSIKDVEAAAAQGINVFMPLRDEKKELAAGKDPYAKKAKDKKGMAELRKRMGTEEAKKIYKERAATAEWVNAGMRNRGLYQFLVRGLEQVRAVVLIQALVHNLFATIRLLGKKNLPLNWTEILRTRLEMAG